MIIGVILLFILYSNFGVSQLKVLSLHIKLDVFTCLMTPQYKCLVGGQNALDKNLIKYLSFFATVSGRNIWGFFVLRKLD